VWYAARQGPSPSSVCNSSKHKAESSEAATYRAATLRSEVTTAYQAPLMNELREVRATHIESYRLVDSFAATVSAGEAAWLKADPAVAEVIPDVTIRAAQP
jgi:hypothetical protein